MRQTVLDLGRRYARDFEIVRNAGGPPASCQSQGCDVAGVARIVDRSDCLETVGGLACCVCALALGDALF